MDIEMSIVTYFAALPEARRAELLAYLVGRYGPAPFRPVSVEFGPPGQEPGEGNQTRARRKNQRQR